MSRILRARAGYLIGLACLGAGLYLAIGLGWALVAAGAGIMAAFVWLYDVDETGPAQPAEPTDIRNRGGEW